MMRSVGGPGKPAPDGVSEPVDPRRWLRTTNPEEIGTAIAVVDVAIKAPDVASGCGTTRDG